MAKLTDKVAVVTGASKGIGAAIAKKLGKEGARVVVNYAKSKDQAQNVVDEIKKAGGDAVAIQADFSNTDEITKFFEEIKKQYGKLDILVNNAGIYEFSPLESVTVEHYRKQFDLNVLGLLWSTKEAAKLFDGNGGAVINVSSVVAQTPPTNGSVYSATKGAVDVITKALAQELGPRKIRVLSVSPGLTDTEGLRDGGHKDAFEEFAVSRTPLGRVGQPEDIANVTAFLVSDEAAWLTGEAILTSGGLRL